MLDLTGLAVLALQLALLTDSSFRIARRQGSGEDAVAFAVATQVIALAQICAVTLALGYTGLLSSPAIVAAHGMVWLGTRLALRAPVPGARPGGEARLRARARPVHVLAAGLALVLVMVALTGTVSEDLVHDSLSYRMSRIGYWLQEGSVRHFPTNETRQSFSAINVDLVMLWLSHPFAVGFPLVTLAQAWGGTLLLLATWGAASSMGLRRWARLGSVLLVLGMPCVFVQIMTSHNDLLTAGLFAAFAYLWLVARETGRWVWPAALALALSIGAKGTVFYMIPAVALLAVVAALSGRPAAAAHSRRLALAVAISLTVFAAPRYVENLLAYGDPFAPPEMYELNHGPTRLRSVPEKAALNFASYVAQTLHPASNPAVLAPLVSPLFRGMVERLPERDLFSIATYPRRATLAGPLFRDPLRTADTVSTGVLVPLLALVGTVLAGVGWMRGEKTSARLVVAGSVYVLGFLACFSGLYLWWPTSFRFFSLIAPFLALAGAWAMERLPPRARVAGWLVAAALSLSVCGEVYFGTVNAGFRAIPPVSVDWLFYSDLLAERAIVSRLDPGSTLGVSLPYNTVLAGFFRGGNGVLVRFVTTETLRRGGSGAAVLRENGLDALVVRPQELPSGGAPALLIGNTALPSFVVFVPPGSQGPTSASEPSGTQATMR